MKNILRFWTFILAITLSRIDTYGETIFGLTNNNSVFIITDPSQPSSATTPVSISGITSGQVLVAIDVRPSDGQLYALGYNSATSQAQLYIVNINGTTYTAAAVNLVPVTLSLGSPVSVGFDFQSTSDDQIYVVSSNGNNYVLNADNGTVVSTGGTIAYHAGDINSSATVSIAAVAYTNSFFGSDHTTLLGYDMANNVTVSYDASLSNTLHTIGASGILLSSGTAVGMDSYYDTTIHSNRIYLLATPSLSAGSSLFIINNTTGLATSLGAIGAGSLSVMDIAIDVDFAIPSTVTGQMMIGLTLHERNLVFFDSENTGAVRDVIPISGVTSGQTVMGIDFRPFDLGLYAIGYNGTNMLYQLYEIDLATGLATAINTPSAIDLGIGNSAGISFDFDPVADRIRVIGRNGMNFQLSPATGLVVATDDPLVYAPGDVNFGTAASIGAIAHTNSYNNAALSQLIGIDLGNSSVVSFSGNGNSSLNTVLNLGNVLGTGLNSNGYMDVYFDESTNTNLGFLATNVGTAGNAYANLYAINTASGATTFIGTVGPGIPLADITAQPDYPGPTFASNLIAEQARIFIYPNPAYDQVRVLLPYIADNIVSVIILDLNGNIVHSMEYVPGGNQLDIDVSALPAGLYSLRVQEYGYEPESVKLVIN